MKGSSAQEWVHKDMLGSAEESCNDSFDFVRQMTMYRCFDEQQQQLHDEGAIC
jgi:hypothetical protein